jgi:WD40 repeat protein
MRAALPRWAGRLRLFAAPALYAGVVLYVWQALAPQPRFTIAEPCRPVGFSSDGHYAVTYRHWREPVEAAGDGYYHLHTGPIQLWDLRTGTPVFSALHDQHDFLGVGMSPDDRWLAVPDGNDQIGRIQLRIFDLRSGKEQRAFDIPLVNRKEFWIKYCFSPDGRWIAYTGTHERGPILLGGLQGEAAPTALEDACPPFVFSPDSKVLAATVPEGLRADPQKGEVRFHDLAMGKVRGVYQTRETSSNLFFSPDGRSLVANCWTKTKDDEGWAVGVWDIATHRELLWLNDASGQQFAPDGKTLLARRDLYGHLLIDTATWTERAVVPKGKAGESEVVYCNGAQSPLVVTSTSWEPASQRWWKYLGFLPYFRSQAQVTVAVRKLATQETVATVHHNGICAPFLAPDGSTLLMCAQPDRFTKPVLQVWDVPPRTLTAERAAALGTLTLAFVFGIWLVRRSRQKRIL